jgi:hypothetical protein
MRKRNEDEADKWLREHDPYYTSMGRSKIRNLRYPYLTPDQEVVRQRMEIPISNIGNGETDIDLDFLEIENRN